MENIIDKAIKEKVNEVLSKKEIPEILDIVVTDNIGEVIEKLVILHIRTWMLEDAISEAKTDSDIANIKRKIDICFKQKRPKLVEAINRMITNAIISGKDLIEDNVKLYKGESV
jgi:hypothetical protein